MNNYRLRPNRSGVSLVEVLFAMMIALFGLAGVLAIFPLAARQAADSYALNQATNGAISATAQSAAADAIMPTLERPWAFTDDFVASAPTSGTPYDAYDPPLNGTNLYKPVKSLKDLYVGLMEKRIRERRGPPAATPPFYPDWQVNVVRREILGQAFCFDPLFISQVVAGAYTNDVIRRTRAPFFPEWLGLNTTTGEVFSTLTPATLSDIDDPATTSSPRLVRVSQIANKSSTGLPLTQALADQFVANVGDILQASIQEDKSFGALREFEGADQGNLVSSSKRQDLSWLAIVVPQESLSTDFAEHFNVTIVCFNKRARTFDLPTGTITEFPAEERIGFVTAAGFNYPAVPGAPLHLSPSLPRSEGPLLNVSIHMDNRNEGDIKVGDAVMLSRHMHWTLPDSYTTPPNGPKIVHRHAVYRVVAVGDVADTSTTAQLTRNVVLQGRPWTFEDLNPAVNIQPAYSDAVKLQHVTTTATIWSDVVAVYEYPVTLKN